MEWKFRKHRHGDLYVMIWRFTFAPWLIAAGYAYSMLVLLHYIERALLM
jgi:hypothetical protein